MQIISISRPKLRDICWSEWNYVKAIFVKIYIQFIQFSGNVFRVIWVKLNQHLVDIWTCLNRT